MNLKTIKVLLFTLLALTLASFLIGCGVSKPVYFLFTALFAIGYAAVWLLCWRCPFSHPVGTRPECGIRLNCCESCRGGRLCPPAECSVFSEIFGKSAIFIGPTESSAPTRRGTNSPKGFRVCSCLLQTLHN